ncbi:MAG TPA: hypothetical protein DIC41_01425 [Alphaproteobacteria bacterium]|nr:hypothetical protein [Alphaproteobacteria bacterium]
MLTADKNKLMDQMKNDAPFCGMPDSLPKIARRLAGANINKTCISAMKLVISSGMSDCVDYAFLTSVLMFVCGAHANAVRRVFCFL